MYYCHTKKIFVVAFLALGLSSFVSAQRYWPNEALNDWKLTLNNGVAYITSPQMASHCANLRAQINMGGTEFDRALYAYALSAKAKNKKLRYVIDSNDTTCVISGLDETD